MYHYQYKVIVLSQDLSLYEKVVAFPSLAGFTNIVTHVDKVDASLQDADLLLCEDSVAVLEQALAVLPAGASKVYLGTAQALEQLDAALLAQLDDAWQLPLGDKLLEAKIAKLFAAIKKDKDYHLTQNYFETLINSIPPLIWFKDIRGAHLKVNDSFCAAVGKVKSDVEGRGHYYIWDLKPEEYAAGEYVCLETEEEVLQAQKTLLFDEKVKTRRGLREFKTYKSPIYDDKKTLIGTVGCAIDVTDEKRLMEKLINAAETDTLTKLYNRRYFYKYMSGIKDAKEPVSIFYLDLDNFKKINDNYGHEAGDELLCRVARILEDIFKEGVCVRFGGDEFVCAIEGKAEEAELAGYAEQFLSQLSTLIEDYHDFAGISASIGIAYTDVIDDVDILLKKSDVAMYEAKNSGKAAYRIAK
ncbi:MAG: sensor domain-containing diguanylate cyclase [Phascolarctobacterium sp.]|nr:sensor domain-containing diguanylate cyclase [Phascolarctobacterium sp.]